MKIRNRILSVRKNCREQFLTLRSNDPKGGCHGWQAIKNCREQFLTLRSNGPQGGCHGWQAIKNCLVQF
jgi:Fe-S cluster assembly iron-binding protein IscA